MSSFVAGALTMVDDDSHRPISPSSPLPAGLTLTENGHAAISTEGLNNNLLALFDKLVRDLPNDTLITSMKSILTDSWKSENTKDSVIDLFLLAFQTRWSRGGKGEKSLFYKMIHLLYCFYPSVIIGLLDLIPLYGYWKDPLLLIKECESNPLLADDNKAYLLPLKSKVWSMFSTQLLVDLAEFELATKDSRSPKLTFCAKFAPSEKKEFDVMLSAVGKISGIMYPGIPSLSAKKKYRKNCSSLRLALAVPEVYECASKFSEIDFNRVTSLCLSRKMKAYLNEKLVSNDDDSETGDRYPESEDRVKCRQNLLKVLTEKGVKGKDLFPHELVEKVQGGGRCTRAVELVIQGQWKAIRDGVEAMVMERQKALEVAKDEIDGITVGGGTSLELGKVVVMADVSGSMFGTPMSVSIAMGILMSEICHPAFRDLVLTFHERPTFHDLSGLTSFAAKVRSLESAPWGGSTNFAAALKLVLKVVEEKRLPQEDIPDIMVVSDMQFDQAGRDSKKWNVMYQNIEEEFKNLGLRLYGKALTPPNIIFWNVRAAEGFPAAADQKGVMFLSGFSPSLMKFVLSGEMGGVEDIVVDEETGMIDVVKRMITPEEALRKILDDDGLAAVREVLESKFGVEIGNVGGEKKGDGVKLEDLVMV